MITLVLIILFSITGCIRKEYLPLPQEKYTLKGIYHRVKKGQTLWRIAKAYNVELEKIININRIPNSSKIKVGQLIFIPGAKEELKVLTIPESFIWPLRGKIISKFGERYNGFLNKGIDIQGRWGEEIYAVKNGKVIFCSNEFRSYGKTIIIDHGGGLSSVYAGNSENLVRLNQKVKQGEVIARVGQGPNRSIPYLHFEIRKESKPQNPLYFLP